MTHKIKLPILFAITILFTTGITINISHAQTVADVAGYYDDVNKVMHGDKVLPRTKIEEKTHPEKIIFSQFKLSGKTPDFDDLAKSSPYVVKAADIDKSAMILSEADRMTTNFGLSDAEAPIIAHTELGVDNYNSANGILTFDELNPQTFFRFSMYDYNIGVVPENIDRFSRIALSEAQANKMYDKLGGYGKIFAEFIMIPTYADSNEPFVNEEGTFWLMKAKIAEVRLWMSNNPESDLIWYFKAPWYTPASKAELDTLYSK